MDSTAELLKRLTEADGVPGNEAEVRAVVKQELEPLGDLTRDHLGSVICTRRGASERPRIMLAGHMDEIGFMVRHISDEGFLRFLQLGGWWDQELLGHRVVIKTRQGDVTGVIGAKPPHLLAADERDKVVKKDEMYIDIGASSKEDVEKAGVRVGDPIVPKSDFEELSVAGRYLCKAFDDRVGGPAHRRCGRWGRGASQPSWRGDDQEKSVARGAGGGRQPDVALIWRRHRGRCAWHCRRRPPRLGKDQACWSTMAP
jgi:endoglucanase